MAGYYLSDDEFIKEWNKYRSGKNMAVANKLSVRGVLQRRRSIETRLGITLVADQHINVLKQIEKTPHSVRRGIDVDKVKRVIVFSDAHFTQDTTTAFRALLKFIEHFKPQVIVCNGDAFDGAILSRFPSINFEKKPTVLEELNACKLHLDAIEAIKPAGCELIWTLGNHDMRFESWLVSRVPEFSGVSGFSLKEHFYNWKTCWSYWIGEETVIKHRHKGGRYAGYNNVTAALGCNVITGHTHVLCSSPITGYQKTYWGVQTGCLADPFSESFEYTEDSVKDWRSGFAMLSFDDGRMLQPELIIVCDENKVEFRGEILEV